LSANIPHIPEKLYLTFKKCKEQFEEIRLAFMSPDGDDAAAKKRKQTQESWAYGSYAAFKDGKWMRTEYIWIDQQRTSKDVLVDKELWPESIDNELLAGFEIDKSTRRGGWHGGNVVWRVTDPRGFTLEISSANLSRIIGCSTITNGVIEGKCIWGRQGSANILLPEGSDVYQQAKKQTKKLATTIPLSQVKPGDVIDIISQFVSEPVAYLGCFEIEDLGIDYSTSKPDIITRIFVKNDPKSRKRYHLIRLPNGEILGRPTLKVSAIVESASVELDPRIVLLTVSASGVSTNAFSSKAALFASSDDPDRCALKIVPFEPDDYVAKSRVVPIYNIDGSWWISTVSCFSGPNACAAITVKDGEIHFDSLAGGLFRKGAYYITQPVPDDPVKKFKLVVEHRGIEHDFKLPYLYDRG